MHSKPLTTDEHSGVPPNTHTALSTSGFDAACCVCSAATSTLARPTTHMPILPPASPAAPVHESVPACITTLRPTIESGPLRRSLVPSAAGTLVVPRIWPVVAIHTPVSPAWRMASPGGQPCVAVASPASTAAPAQCGPVAVAPPLAKRRSPYVCTWMAWPPVSFTVMPVTSTDMVTSPSGDGAENEMVPLTVGSLLVPITWHVAVVRGPFVQPIDTSPIVPAHTPAALHVWPHGHRPCSPLT
mmetsp:Transcript_51690/g.126884  ORF Transcript_51690/g.126884 Transcript_51690/m.126884 type:complete len:243 (+) Transcript_51690:212-940(+)